MSTTMKLERPFPGGRVFRVLVGDLLDQPVEAIVNAANGMLAHGGGVAAAIAEAAGDDFDEECHDYVRRRGRIPTGGAALTSAGRLPFKGVIHAVGPRLGEGNEEELLVRALGTAFGIAHQWKFRSLAFPAVSSGIFSVPPAVCARAYLGAVHEFYAARQDTLLREIRLALYLGPVLDAVAKEWAPFWARNP